MSTRNPHLPKPQPGKKATVQPTCSACRPRPVIHICPLQSMTGKREKMRDNDSPAFSGANATPACMRFPPAFPPIAQYLSVPVECNTIPCNPPNPRHTLYANSFTHPFPYSCFPILEPTFFLSSTTLTTQISLAIHPMRVGVQ